MIKSIAKHEAFMNVLSTGQLKTKAQQIYHHLLNAPKTIEFFRTTLGMAHQSCTAALSRLEDSGFVYKLRTVKSGTQSFTLYAAETDKAKAQERAVAVAIFKKQEWLKKGIKNGWVDESGYMI